MDFTVAIVDDDEICLIVHKRIIEITKFHNEARTFNSAKKALDFFATLVDTSKPVLLFLDINMPDMNGWDLLNIIHQEDFKQEIYVVMVSSSVNASDKDKAFSFTKVIDFVEKPFALTVPERLKSKLPWMKDGYRKSTIK
jgi:two-component SAPR family response regulator